MMRAILSFLVVLPVFASEIELNPVEVVRPDEDYSSARFGKDTASLLEMKPGLSIRTGGGLSSQPTIHGLSNDRINIRIDDVQITSACSNHMNPALSYIDPNKIEFIETMAGITPVSYGGDSLGGSILVKSKSPVFSEKDELYRKLRTTTYHRSNNDNVGATIEAAVASKNLHFQYSGLDERARGYEDGNGDRLKATSYNQNNQSAKFAGRIGEGIVALKLSRAIVPYQGFVNQYMDMTNNKADAATLSYVGEFGQTLIETNVSHQVTEHFMDKLRPERPGKMPMETHSNEFGYNLKTTHSLSSKHSLKIGGEYNQFRLDDWWPPVTTTVSGMGPGNFKSIHSGARDRWGLFSEINSTWSNQFSTLLGVRVDHVRMNTGKVEGYNTASNLPADAADFNSKDRSKRDENLDATLSGRYITGPLSEIEFGYARKSRSPNLYERYAWAGSVTDPASSGPLRMDMRMINWYGDGNGYVGNINLKPEVAHTGSASLILKKSDSWNVTFTPYYTYVQNYIDADVLATADGVNYLRFANHDAVIMGTDLSGSINLSPTLKLNAIANYTRGYRHDGKSDLYHLMPLNGKLQLVHELDKWSNQLTVHLVQKKDQVSKIRLEPETAGYALIDLATNYQFTKQLKVELAVLNLLDKNYALPLGGIDIVNAGAKSHTPVPGMGRSINTMVSLDF